MAEETRSRLEREIELQGPLVVKPDEERDDVEHQRPDATLIQDEATERAMAEWLR
jgi:hypothetical protein